MPPGYAAVGAVILVLYGVVASLQQARFGRVYAAYGGVFIAMSLAWGTAVDGDRPDRWDIAGATVIVQNRSGSAAPGRLPAGGAARTR